MESDLLEAWRSELYWIAMKYDLDPTKEEVIRLFEEIYEEGWKDGHSWGLLNE